MLGELDSHVGLSGAGGDVPVDTAHVVAGLVGPHLMELAADACIRRAEVPCKEPVDPAADRKVEQAQRIRGDGSRSWLRRGADAVEDVGDVLAHHARGSASGPVCTVSGDIGPTSFCATVS